MRPFGTGVEQFHGNGTYGDGDAYRGSAGFFAAQAPAGAGRSQLTPWPPPEPSQLQPHQQRLVQQQREGDEQGQSLGFGGGGTSPSRADPFAARPNLNKLSFDMGGDEDPGHGRTEKDVMYLGGELGLLDDDGSQLRPVEEPGTDPEPWKVFTPLSYQPGQGESLVEMMTNTVTNTVGAGVNMLRRLTSPLAAQGQNYDAFAAQPPPLRQQTGRKAEAASGSNSGGGTSWWERFSPTAAMAKAKSTDSIFSVPPPREPSSARGTFSSTTSAASAAATDSSNSSSAATDSSNSSWWTRFSPRAVTDTAADSSGGWWGFSPRYASHPNASLGGGFGFNPFASTSDASALAAQAAAQNAANDSRLSDWPS